MPDLKSVLHGLETLREIDITEMPPLMDSVIVASDIIKQTRALEYRTVMQKDGHPDVVLREEPGERGKILRTRLQNGISVEIIEAREIQGYTKVRFGGQGHAIEGWGKTEKLVEIARSQEFGEIANQALPKGAECSCSK